MVTSLSPTGVDLTRDEYLEFWVFQPGSRTADSAGVRLVLRPGHASTRMRWRLAPDSITVTGRDTLFTGRQSWARPARYRAQQASTSSMRRWTTSAFWATALTPDGWHTGALVDALPLCQRILSTRGAGLSLGRPQRPMHQRERHAWTPRT